VSEQPIQAAPIPISPPPDVQPAARGLVRWLAMFWRGVRRLEERVAALEQRVAALEEDE